MLPENPGSLGKMYEFTISERYKFIHRQGKGSVTHENEELKRRMLEYVHSKSRIAPSGKTSRNVVWGKSISNLLK